MLIQVPEGYLHVCMCMTKSQDRESIAVAGVPQDERNDHSLAAVYQNAKLGKKGKRSKLVGFKTRTCSKKNYVLYLAFSRCLQSKCSQADLSYTAKQVFM